MTREDILPGLRVAILSAKGNSLLKVDHELANEFHLSAHDEAFMAGKDSFKTDHDCPLLIKEYGLEAVFWEGYEFELLCKYPAEWMVW